MWILLAVILHLILHLISAALSEKLDKSDSNMAATVGLKLEG